MILTNDKITTDLSMVDSPCFVVDQQALERNLSLLDQVQKNTGAKILLALKGFSMFKTFPILNKVLAGTCASSIDEAQLGFEEFGGEVHTFSPAYSEKRLKEILAISDHVVFNSANQWRRFKDLCQSNERTIEFGLRINPEHSEGEVALYDPCSPSSRLGICLKDLQNIDLNGISGLHFHTLCEQDSYALERTLKVVEYKFGHLIPQMKWINFGGGHHISRPDYKIDHLCGLINNFREKYDVQVYLEPGEAVALNAGVLLTTVLDIINNGVDIAILDTSASTHMPDVIEMPYRPHIVGSALPNEKEFTYRLGGNSCLAGDIVGDYSFAEPLKIGDRLVFTDMAHYSMVKTTTFNGVRLPSIALCNHGKVEIVKEFGYSDFKNRLS